MRFKVGDTVVITKVLDEAESEATRIRWNSMIGKMYTIIAIDGGGTD